MTKQKKKYEKLGLKQEKNIMDIINFREGYTTESNLCEQRFGL